MSGGLNIELRTLCGCKKRTTIQTKDVPSELSITIHEEPSILATVGPPLATRKLVRVFRFSEELSNKYPVYVESHEEAV